MSLPHLHFCSAPQHRHDPDRRCLACAQLKFSHLNIAIEGGIPHAAEGLLAELAGVRPRSQMTEASLVQGRKKHSALIESMHRRQNSVKNHGAVMKDAVQRSQPSHGPSSPRANFLKGKPDFSKPKIMRIDG